MTYDIHKDIAELRAELAEAFLTRLERAEAAPASPSSSPQHRGGRRKPPPSLRGMDGREAADFRQDRRYASGILGIGLKRPPVRRSVPVFDILSGLGGTHTVSILAELGVDRVRVRVWCGRATPTGWEAWQDWDGYAFETARSALTNPRSLSLFPDEARGA